MGTGSPLILAGTGAESPKTGRRFNGGKQEGFHPHPLERRGFDGPAARNVGQSPARPAASSTAAGTEDTAAPCGDNAAASESEKQA